MKRIIALIAVLAMMIGCASSYGLNLAYMAASAPKVQAKAVYLLVKDLRADKMVVTPEVQKKGLFKEVGSFLHLTARTSTGRITRLSEASVQDAFQEAFRARLESMGFRLLPKIDPASPVLTIEVNEFVLGVDGRHLKASVVYSARFSKGDQPVRKEKVTGGKSEIYLSGKKTGEKIMSEVFTSAVNRLDLIYLNR